MATDHHKVDEAVFAELGRHFSEAEIVELGVSTALFIGLGRFNTILGVDPVEGSSSAWFGKSRQPRVPAGRTPADRDPGGNT